MENHVPGEHSGFSKSGRGMHRGRGMGFDLDQASTVQQ